MELKTSGIPFSSSTRAVLAVLALFATGAAFAGTTLVWTGGGASDNFSDTANWNPQQAPASGDTLEFQGETRTAPVNDLDPESYVFEKILFTNDGSAGKAAPFTLSGNKLRVSSAILGVQPSSALVETIGLDVEATGKLSIGGTTGGVNRHGFTFNGKVSGPANANLENTSQYSSVLTFNGPIEGFALYYRPNGGGDIYFNGANNAFAASGIGFGQGNLHIVDASNLGPAKSFRTGQGGYPTAGTLFITPTNDVTIASRIGLSGPSQSNNGLTIRNETAGTCVTFTGEFFEEGTKTSNGWNAGTRLNIDGDGDGRFAGSFTKDRTAFTKSGSGTWTFGSEIETCALTGLVSLVRGRLRVDCTVPTYRLTASAGTVLAGSGALGSAEIPTTVDLVAGMSYEPGTDAAGAVKGLTVNGTLSLAGNLPVNLPSGVVLAPGSRTLLMRYGAKTGAGAFTPGTGFPANVVLTVTPTELYADIPTDTYTWTGSESAVWDKATANWLGGRVFTDHAPVEFPDLADETKRTVTIPSAVSPLSLDVTASAEHPYVFSGAGGLADVSQAVFSGTATNVWAAPLRNAGSVTVAGGALRLAGETVDSSVTVASGAGLELVGPFTGGTLIVENGGTFTQAVDGVIGGDAQIVLRCAKAALDIPNTFTGGASFGWNKQEGSGNPTTEILLNHSKALGVGGDVTLGYGTSLRVHVDVAETNRTLHYWGYNNSVNIRVDGNHVFDWAGDVVVHMYPQGELFFCEGNNAAHFGKADGTSTFSTTHGRAVTLVGGDLHLHANYYSGSSLGFRGTMYVYNTNNVWSVFGINTGTAVMMAKDALPGNKPISMLQQWNNVNYYSTLDLNGFDQTVTAITTDYNKAVKNGATLKSKTAATLTVSNVADSVFADVATFAVTDALSLRKMGPATWTLGCVNSSTGNVEVLEGTLALVDAASLPVGATSKLVLGEGAVLGLAEGVTGEIAYAEQIVGEKARPVAIGVYGGPDCAVDGVKKVDWISGAGTLFVRRQETAGTVLIFR